MMVNGDAGRVEELIREGVGSARSISAARRAGWLSIRSEMNMRFGNITRAIEDAVEATRLLPTPESRASLGMLYAAALRYSDSASTLRPLLEEFNGHQGTALLTDEEWGQIVVQTYISRKRTIPPQQASLILRGYSDAYRGHATLKKFLTLGLIGRLLKEQADLVSLGDVTVETPWSHVVARFMLDPSDQANDLTVFRDLLARDQRIDSQAFECMRHYYTGMAKAIRGAPAEAKREFAEAAKIPQEGYVEYWIAKAEAERRD
jgi:hypothetical protein